jgi:hypothetical protein
MNKRQILKRDRKRLEELVDDYKAVKAHYIRVNTEYKGDPSLPSLHKCYTNLDEEIVSLRERIRMIDKTPHYTEDV